MSFKCIYRPLSVNAFYIMFLFQIYMLPNFSLENPDTFNAVFPWSQIEQSSHTGKQASSKLLQEKVIKLLVYNYQI